MTKLGMPCRQPTNIMLTTPPVSPSTRSFASIRTRLLLWFGSVLLVILLVVGLGYWALQSLRTVANLTLQEVTPIRELSLEIENDFLAARESEASFMSRWRSIGFDAAVSLYIPTNQNHLARARKSLNDLQALVQNSHDATLNQLATETARLQPLLDSYESIFSSTVLKIDKRSRNNELEQALQNQLAAMEAVVAALPDNTLHDLLTTISANERDYFNSGQQQFVDNVQIAINQYLAEARALGRDNLAAQAETYWNTFNTIATLDREVEANTSIFRDLTTDITSLTTAIRQGSEQGIQHARDDLQMINDRSILILVLSGVLALALTIAVTATLARRIMPPLNQLTTAAQHMAKGDLEQRVPVKGNDEFTVLAEAFNLMASQLEDLINSLEQRVSARTAEIDAVLQVSLSLTSNLSLHEVLNLIVESAYQLLHNPRDVQIFLYENNRLQFGAAISDGVLQDKAVREPRPNGLTYTVVRSGRPAIVPNMKTDPHYANEEMEGAVVSFPLTIGERVVGAVNFTYAYPHNRSSIGISTLLFLRI